MADYNDIELEFQLEWADTKERLEWADIDLRECLEIIYPAYKNLVDKYDSKECWWKKYYYTKEQVLIENLQVICSTYEMMDNHYLIDVFTDELWTDDNGITLRTETNVSALLLLAGNAVLHPNAKARWGDVNWSLLHECLKNEYNENYDSYVQEIKDNQIKYQQEHADEICEELRKECEKLKAENKKYREDIHEQPDKIYKEIIQKAQDAINHGDDINAMKVALYTLMPERYYKIIRELQRQQHPTINHFHEGATCNQAETIIT